MSKIKDSLLGLTALGGITIFRLLVIFIGIFPLFLLPIPWWAGLIIFLIIINSVLVGDILHVIVYIWAFPHAFDYSTPIVVLFFVSFIISIYNWIGDFRTFFSSRN